MSPRLLLLPVLAALLVGSPALADTRRVAVLVGNNVGSGDRPPLRFAETDAGKMARVLTELGDVAPDDLFLLQGKGLAQLRDTLNLATRRISSWRGEPGTRVVLLFYFSGHSDGVALELGRERLTFTALREWLERTGAEVRLAVVDSCRSGALLRAKGGTPGPAFQIKLADDVASAGQVLLTSSAEDEVSLESKEIGGSFFTHHLVSGLRGAADASGDGQVTLTEAYQYAFSCTVTATSNTFTGGQHPAYDYRLSGQGDLVLTQVHTPASALELPEGFERALLIQILRDQILVELPAGAPRKVALPPGEYAVKVWRGGKLHRARVRVGTGEAKQLRWEELPAEAGPTVAASAKGEEPELEVPVPEVPVQAEPVVPFIEGAELTLGPGVRGTAALGGELMPLAHLSYSGRGTLRLVAGLELGSLRVGEIRETVGQLSLGLRWNVLGRPGDRFQAYLGMALVGQLIHQTSGAQVIGWLVSPGLGPWVGVRWPLSDSVLALAEVHAPITLLKRQDGPTSTQLIPSGRLGVAFVLR
ncbi:caspase family protein [Archangium violaceum]|uniref:caspase family protein n=1 Tax=Archangium violaceum TaxID=83451 RepID=UPI0019508124|nr:caspase family protein [Archangium violaceum]QRN96776.1 caspase family protein [Archangium violaceum]